MTAFEGPSVANTSGQHASQIKADRAQPRCFRTVYLHELLTSSVVLSILVIVDVVAGVGAMLGLFL